MHYMHEVSKARIPPACCTRVILSYSLKLDLVCRSKAVEQEGNPAEQDNW